MPVPPYQTFEVFMAENPILNHSSRVYVDPTDPPPITCIVGLYSISSASVLVSTWTPDPVNWPEDIISPAFGNYHFSHLPFATPLGGLFLSTTGNLVASFQYWDWFQGPTVKFQGRDRFFLADDGTWLPGDYVGGGSDACEVFNMSNGQVIGISDANIHLFSADGEHLAGAMYGTTIFNQTWGACAGSKAGEFYQIGDHTSGVLLRRWQIPPGSTTGMVVELQGTPVMLQTPTQKGNGAYVNGRLLRSQNTLAVCLTQYRASPPAGETQYLPFVRFFKAEDLTEIGTMQPVHDTANLYFEIIAFKTMPRGGFAVLYVPQNYYWGDSEGAPSGVFLRLRIFNLDGTPRGASIALYEMEALSWTHSEAVGKRIAHDFSFTDDERYVILSESHNTAVDDNTYSSVVKASAFDLLNPAAPVQVGEPFDLNPTAFNPPNQDRPLSNAVWHVGNDDFAVAYNQYESNTEQPNGGRTPLYSQWLNFERCETVCQDKLVPIGPRWVVAEDATIESNHSVTPAGTKGFFTTYRGAADKVYKTQTLNDNTNQGSSEIEPGTTVYRHSTNAVTLQNNNFVVVEGRMNGSLVTSVWLTTFNPAGTVVAGPTKINSGGSGFGTLGGIALGDSNTVYVYFNTADSSDPQYVQIGKYDGMTHATLISPVMVADANAGSNLYYLPYRSLVRVGNHLVIWYLRQPTGTTQVRCYAAIYDLSLNLIAGAIQISSDLTPSGSAYEFEDAEDTLGLRRVTDTTWGFAWINRPANGASAEGAALYYREFDVTGDPVMNSVKLYDMTLLAEWSSTIVDRYPFGYAVKDGGQHLVVGENLGTFVGEFEDLSSQQAVTLFKRTASNGFIETHTLDINRENYKYDGIDYGGYVEPLFLNDGSLVVFMFTESVNFGTVTRFDLAATRFRIETCPTPE